MLFNSYLFISFFLLVYGLYLILGHRAQNWLLLFASNYFYGCWDWRFLFLLWLTMGIDYFCGLKIHRSRDEKVRRFFIVFSMVSNLGILFFFKYFGFFGESLRLFLAQFGVEVGWVTLNIVLPVGISFYTFQSMSYTLDVYRRQLEPTSDPVDFIVFVTYFPQLVAGPIERATHLLGQVQKPRTVTYTMVREGAWLILFGYYKKVVLADNVAPFVNVAFADPTSVHGVGVPVAILAFAIQIYGDFSGYTDIARGISRLMGFDLMVNFRMPYFALSPKQFWQRWHISLSTWLRDYLYLPLGGNRKGPGRTYVNLMMTMALGGLWHGAAWNFVMWGVYQGLLLVIYRALRWEEPLARLEHQRLSLGKVGAWAVFMVLVGFGWCLFRISSLHDLVVLMQNMFTGPFLTGKTALLTMLVFGLPVLALDTLQEKRNSLMVIKQFPVALRYTIYLALFALILVSGNGGGSAFIYFQF